MHDDRHGTKALVGTVRLVQSGARRRGKDGIHGNGGNVVSVTY
jgi:hypothetical protein